MISRMRLLIPTLWRLGPGAVATVALYRLACRLGIYRRLLPIRNWTAGGDFFGAKRLESPSLATESCSVLQTGAENLLAGKLFYFSKVSRGVGSPPDWFLDPVAETRLAEGGHWSQLNEFGSGDIKIIWEASRFEWTTFLARAWRLNGDERYLETLNNWLVDWTDQNPANSGPNWKCGQETSIRAINLLLTAHLLGTQDQPSAALIELVAVHCGRILPTIRYAVAQNNNHGTSEAAALFICGAWLLARSDSKRLQRRARCWRNTGRRWLENRVEKLVGEDGSFAQYSVNYHRVLVDTLCQVEFWRRELDEASFSDQYLNRCRASVDWLTALTDVDTGDVPNLGANDGARLYDLSSSPYRDFRPTVQLSSVLFKGVRVYEDGTWDEPLQWLEFNASDYALAKPAGSVLHSDGGDVVLCIGKSFGLIRYARFKYRPSHADCLHLDLWHRGQNVLRDGGTYSYNTEPEILDYFSGTESHNTVQFDGRNQMPRISRFLFGNWLKMSEVSEVQQVNGRLLWSGAYNAGEGATHRRTIEVDGLRWLVKDEISGFRDKAVLRWRLAPGQWLLDNHTCNGELATLSVESSTPVKRMELVTGWESRHYLEKTELPVFEIEVGPGPAVLKTVIDLSY